MKSLRLSAVLSLAASSLTNAQVASYCPGSGSGICYAVNVPSSTSSSGSGDIFFQIKGPTSAQWIAVGEGSSMSGSNIFVIYSSADGKNVTLSPRLGSGHVEPGYNGNAKVTLLEGSGISGGQMIANVKCSSCSSWNGGELDVSSSSSSWIWATKSGSAINSDNNKAEISRHDKMGGFSFDLTKATGGSSDNPFLDLSTPDPSSTGSAASPSSSSGNGRNGWGPFGWGGPYGGNDNNDPNSGNPGSSDNSGNNGNSGSSSSSDSAAIGTTPRKLQSIRTAHCIVMSLTFLVLLPIGAILMRVLSFPSLVYIHAIAQLFSLTLALSGFALGVWYIRTTKQPFSSQPHYILGTAVISMLLLQPFFGFLHHAMYRQYERKTFMTLIHVWYGRLIFLLALVNGALGLKLGKSLRGGMETATITYSVIAAVVGTLYIAVLLFSAWKGNRKGEEKYVRRSERRLGSMSRPRGEGRGYE
ncbi:MAG: hypothetical protein M1840_000475 [Geoglossum simile]|nr:MAG: hypothetical protein M1840_000475 [Geoglossum simile]